MSMITNNSSTQRTSSDYFFTYFRFTAENYNSRIFVAIIDT